MLALLLLWICTIVQVSHAIYYLPISYNFKWREFPDNCKTFPTYITLEYEAQNFSHSNLLLYTIQYIMKIIWWHHRGIIWMRNKEHIHFTISYWEGFMNMCIHCEVYEDVVYLIYIFKELVSKTVKWEAAVCSNCVGTFYIAFIVVKISIDYSNRTVKSFMKWSDVIFTGLMIMASHQTFSGQVKHLSGQITFGQTNFLYIINGNFAEFAKENECPDNFQCLS